MCADTNVVSYMHINYCKLSVDIVVTVGNVISNSSFFPALCRCTFREYTLESSIVILRGR